MLDPSKNVDADALLDTLGFEAGNALRRTDHLEKKPVADVEFEVVEGYVAMLMQAVGTKSFYGLLASLGVDRKYLQRFADPVRSIRARAYTGFDGKAVMPPKSEMREERKRAASAAFLELGWTREERRRYFGVSAHAEGMGRVRGIELLATTGADAARAPRRVASGGAGSRVSSRRRLRSQPREPGTRCPGSGQDPPAAPTATMIPKQGIKRRGDPSRAVQDWCDAARSERRDARLRSRSGRARDLARSRACGAY